MNTSILELTIFEDEANFLLRTGKFVFHARVFLNGPRLFLMKLVQALLIKT
jgi:hypothetical protein